MPLLTLHLCRLNVFTSVKSFLAELSDESSVKIIFAGRPRQVINKPQNLDVESLGRRYELLLLLETPKAAIPSNLRGHVWYEYKITVDIPTTQLETLTSRNTKPTSPARLSGALDSRGKQALNSELYAFIQRLTKSYGDKPVVILDVPHHNGAEGCKAYNSYREALKPMQQQRGAEVLTTGSVVHSPTNGGVSPGEEPTGSKEGAWWDAFSLERYPSVSAFGDMLADERYEQVGRKEEGAFRDCLSICLTAIELPKGEGAKL